MDAVQALDFFKAVDGGVGWQLALQGVHVPVGLQAHKGGQEAAGNAAKPTRVLVMLLSA